MAGDGKGPDGSTRAGTTKVQARRRGRWRDPARGGFDRNSLCCTRTPQLAGYEVHPFKNMDMDNHWFLFDVP